MALSNQRVVSDGTLVTLDVSFDFFDHSEIGVYFDSAPQTEGPAPSGTWEWGSTANIVFDPAVPNGVEVMIQRKTDASELRHEFSKGSEFKVDTLDENFRQVLHIVQEATESNFSKDFFDDINMNGKQILNLGPATQDNHTISLGDVKNRSDTAWQAASQAAASASNASTSASVAGAAAAAANTSATTADGHRQAAAASASSAGASATTATQQAQGASASSTAAAQSSTAAAQHSDLASKWAIQMTGPVAGGEYSAKYWASQAVSLALPDAYITQAKLVAALSTKIDQGATAFTWNYREAAVVLNPGTDLNGDYVSGMYFVQNPANAPRNAGGYWFVELIRVQADTALQRASYHSGNSAYTDSVWTRTRIAGTWQPWVELAAAPAQTYVYLSGNAANPGNIGLAHYSGIANPYPGWVCDITPQIYIEGNWGDPKWASNAGTSNLSYGLSAAQMDEFGPRNFIIRSGNQSLQSNGAVTGSPFSGTTNITSAPFRLLVVRQCRPPT